MAAPTQEYPPWLTPVPETIYGVGGVPISTSTTILYLPLTYYGPSIPLGSEWTYGGLTPPASTSTVIVPTTVTPTTSPTSTTTPSTSTSTATSTSTSSSPTSFISSVSSQSSSTSTSSTATPSTKHALLSHNQLIGIIIGAVIGALVIILALFVCFLVIKNRRREQQARSRRNVLSIDQDYVVVDDSHVPGDGSPRHSGEERDSLLQAHTETPVPIIEPRYHYQRTIERSMPPAQPATGSSSQPVQRIPPELGARPGPTRVPILPPDTHSSLNSGTSGSSTEMSSLGSLVPNSRFSRLSPLVEEQREIRRSVLATRFRGPILTPQEQRRVEETSRPESSGKENDESGSGLSSLPPPPSRGSGGSGSTQVRTAFIPYIQRNIKTGESHGSSNRSSAQTDIEDAALVTARRVKPVDWSVRASPYYLMPGTENPNASTSSGGIISSISSRLSWFRNLDALSGSMNRRSGVTRSSDSSERDPEVSKALLSPIISEASESQSASNDQVQRTGPESSQFNIRPRLVVAPGLLSDGTRPISGTSGRSGASSSALTTYYDARSSTPALTPPPRAVTPAPGPLGSRPSSESNDWRLPSLALSSASLHISSEQAHQEVLQALAEFGGRSNEAFLAYNENDTITREHARGLPSNSSDVDALDVPVPSPLPNFRNTFGAPPMSAFGAPPMSAFASTSTALSNSNTISTSAPTLFTHGEGTLSTSTSESSLKEASDETARPGDYKHGPGSGTGTFSNMVHVPFMGAGTFAVKEAKSWSESSDSLLPDNVIVPSRETSQTSISMTGTTLATIDENTTSTTISVDLLEEEPPRPGEGWRSLAGAIGESAAGAWEGMHRRFTMEAPTLDRRVQHGSLPSIRSHPSSNSSGSAPASRRDISGSSGSSGSRSSARYSLANSGSTSSFEGRRRYISPLRYQAYSGSMNSGSISPTLSAFGSHNRRQTSDEGTPILRNLAQQYPAESDSSYYTASLERSNGGMQGVTMEIEEDVVDAARAAMNSGHDREFGVRSPRGRNESDASLKLSSAPWAAGLDKNWMPL